MIYVGLDVHKESVQMATIDGDGKLLSNKKIPSDFESVSEAVSKIPKKAKYVRVLLCVVRAVSVHD